MSERIKWVDILKGIGIIFVVAGHLVDYNSVFTRYLFTFHMPLFFFISGYCFESGKYDTFRKFISKKFRTLIIPYFSLCAIGMVVVFSNMYLINHKPINFYTMFRDIFIVAQPESVYVGQVWFLVCMFITELMYFLITQRTKKYSSILIVLCIFAIVGEILGIMYYHTSLKFRLPWKIDVAFTTLMFFGIGNLIKSTSILDKVKIKYFLIPSFAVGLVFGPFLNIGINICNINYRNPIYFYISSLSSILFYVLIAHMIKQSRALEFLGKNSLIIFGTHSFVMSLIIWTLNSFNISAKILSMSLGLGLFCTVITIMIEIPIVFIVKKYIPFMFGLKNNLKIQQVSRQIAE